MSGLKLVDGTVVDIGVELDAERRIVLSPRDPVFITDFVTLSGLDTDAMATGDALGTKNLFTGIPTSGVIHSIVVADAAKQSINLDVYFFSGDIAGTANNAAFDPTDIEIKTSLGVVLVDTWKANADNSIGSIDNIGLPYSVPSGIIYFQLVTRGTPTFVGQDISIRLGIIV